MARMKKSQPRLETVFFSTPAQKVIRLLLSQPTLALTPRIICSKLKGVRGLGGAEGLSNILQELHSLELVDFVDNHRAVRIQMDNMAVQVLATFGAICDLESLGAILKPISSKGVLLGNRGKGKTYSEGDYHLFVVSELPDGVKEAAAHHPLGREVELVVWTPEMYGEIKRSDPSLSQKVTEGIVLWGSTW